MARNSENGGRAAPCVPGKLVGSEVSRVRGEQSKGSEVSRVRGQQGQQ